MIQYGITKEELHPTLLEFIENIAGQNQASIVKHLKSNTKLGQSAKEVQISIKDFDKTTDLLFVYKNSVYLEEKLDYNISEDNLKITSTNSETWATGTEFNFICLKNIPELGDNYSVNGSRISVKSITKDKLDQALQDLIDRGSNNSDIDGGTF